jgi:hypothetical protein
MVRLFPEGHPWRARLLRLAEALRLHKTSLAVAAGLALQWAALSTTLSRPLGRDIARLQSEVASASARMDQLVASRGSACHVQDLLSALEAQRVSLDSAEQALADIRQLRMNLEQEARRTAAAASALGRMAHVQQQLVQAGQHTGEAAATVEQFAQLQSRVEGLAEPSQAGLSAAEQADAALKLLASLQSRLASQNAALPAALASVDQADRLHAALAAAGQQAVAAEENSERLLQIAAGLNTVEAGQVDVASQHAADLLALHDLLADGRGLRLDAAESNLRALLATQSELVRATPQIGAAAENLELLCAFQDELTRQLGALTQVRKDLLEVTMLRHTVAAVAEAVGPLAELAEMRQLDADHVRAMAREILDRRTAQAITSEDPAALPLPASSPADSLVVPEPMELP